MAMITRTCVPYQLAGKALVRRGSLDRGLRPHPKSSQSEATEPPLADVQYRAISQLDIGGSVFNRS